MHIKIFALLKFSLNNSNFSLIKKIKKRINFFRLSDIWENIANSAVVD